MVFDIYLTNKAIEGVAYVSGKIGDQLVKTGNQLKKLIPAPVIDEVVVFMQTSTGENIAVSQKTLQNLDVVACNQQAINRAAKIARAEELTHDVQKLTQANPKRIAKIKAQFEKYYKSDALLPGLEKIEGVKQIENYRAITKNFTTIEQLSEADVMYLNMCNGLYAHSVEINNLVEKAMLSIVDQNRKIIQIHKFDIYHSFLSEMKPSATGPAKLGGHLFFPESKAFTHTIEKIVPFENGYFDLFVRHIADETGKFVPKTQFPLGAMPVENAKIIIDLIQEVKIPYYINTDLKGKTTCDFLKQCGQRFSIYIEDGVATFHPISPNAPRRGI